MTNATTTIKHGELNLRSVTGRKAIAGDFVVFKKSYDGTPQGQPFEVLSDADSYNSNTQRYVINGWGGSERYDLYEEATFKAGDRVKILALSKFGKDYIGKIGVVERAEHYGYISARPEGDEYYPDGIYTADQLELQSEVQPEEEKTMAPTMTRMFKVGDKVRVHAAANGRYGDLFDGAEGVIEDIDSYYEEMYRVSSEAAGDYDRFEAKDIELIADSPVEFKVGDKVEVLDASKGMFEDQRDGAIGTIEHIADQHVGIRVSIDGDFDRYPASALRKVPVATAAKLTFNVGDKVRMISTNPHHGMGEIKTGDIGTLRSVSGRMLTASFPRQSYWNGLASEFELVEEEEFTFEEGDFIRIMDKDEIDGAYDTTNGKTYEIIDVDEDGDIEIMDDDNETLCILRSEFVAIEKVDAPKASKFSKGDKAILTSDDGAATMGFRVGDEVTIVGTSLGMNDYEIVRQNARGYASARHLTAVGSHEVPAALKVAKEGDFIEIDFDFVGGAFSLRDITQGKAYKVETSGYTKSLVFKDDVGDNRGAHLKQGAYTVVDAPAEAKVAAKAYQFVQGDFVRFTDAEELDCADYITNGKVYEVIREDSPGFFIEDDGGDEIYIGGYEAPYYEKVDAPARKLQVGDIVRIDRERGNRGGSRNEEGDIGLIAETDAHSSRVNVSGRGHRGNFEFNSDLTLIVAKENRED